MRAPLEINHMKSLIIIISHNYKTSADFHSIIISDIKNLRRWNLDKNIACLTCGSSIQIIRGLNPYVKNLHIVKGFDKTCPELNPKQCHFFLQCGARCKVATDQLQLQLQLQFNKKIHLLGGRHNFFVSP